MIELLGVGMQAGKFVLQDINCLIPSGSYAVLMGRTGCGKSSLLEAICGLRSVASGSILISGVDVTRWSVADRGIGYVPQDLALFPTLTVAEHLQFALRIRRWSRAAIAERTEQLATELGIKHLLSRRVRRLSGGEAQRTALGRALSFYPDVLLLDEPLSALDEATRREIGELLHFIKTTNSVTTLHVTHNQAEAEQLADLRLQLSEGQMLVL